MPLICDQKKGVSTKDAVHIRIVAITKLGAGVNRISIEANDRVTMPIPKIEIIFNRDIRTNYIGVILNVKTT